MCAISSWPALNLLCMIRGRRKIPPSGREMRHRTQIRGRVLQCRQDVAYLFCERTHSQTRIRRARRVHHLNKKALQAVCVCARDREYIRNERHQQFLGPLWMYRPDASNVRQRSERKMGSRTIPTAGILAGEIMAHIKQRHLCSLSLCIESYGFVGTKEKEPVDN